MRSFHIVSIALGIAVALQAQSAEPIADGPNYIPQILRESKIQPPPPITEQTGTAPGSDYIWMPGYYYCETGDCTTVNPKVSVWVWISGNWAGLPFPGAIWTSHRWLQTNAEHWILEAGYWRHRETSTQPIAAQGCPAPDSVDCGIGVLNPDIGKAADPEPQAESRSSQAETQPQQEKFVGYIINGQIMVASFQDRWFRFYVAPGEQRHIIGNFDASGHGITAFIENGFVKKDKKKGIPGRRPTFYWTTESAQSGNIDIILGPGWYYLHFLNSFSFPVPENPETVAVNAQMAIYSLPNN